MNNAVLNSMTKTERRLVSKAERDALIEPDEGALLELHGRERRARTKYLKNYRRPASARVAESGSRGGWPTQRTSGTGTRPTCSSSLLPGRAGRSR
jgi:hypothetical protein